MMMNKIYIPQVKDEIIVAKPWTFKSTSEKLKDLFNLNTKIYSKETITLPKGTVLRIASIDSDSTKVYSISLNIRKLNNKKISLKNGFFSVELNDFNRLFIETSETQGIMNIDVRWSNQNWSIGDFVYGHVHLKKGNILGKGYVRIDDKQETAFIIRLSDIDIKDDHITNIKVKLFETITNGKENELVEYKSIPACSRFGNKWVSDNKKYFLSSYQKKILRTEKITRLTDDE